MKKINYSVSTKILFSEIKIGYLQKVKKEIKYEVFGYIQADNF